MTQNVSHIEQLCTDKGMKMTEQRRAIARVLSDATDHPHGYKLVGHRLELYVVPLDKEKETET